MSRKSRVGSRQPVGLGAAFIVLAATAACDGAPIEWRDVPARLAVEPLGEEAPVADDARLVLGPNARLAIEPLAPAPTSPTRSDSMACESSIRLAPSGRGEVFGVWWSRRGDGTALLRAARSDDDGVTWGAPVAVDTTDRWAVACSRPAPAIAADSASQYVHVTYFLHGPDGPGVFFSHSMDRGALFHAPVPILYGERPAATAVAAQDRTVVVAFEDPNSKRPQVSLAVSRTWGHIFARERPEASSLEAPAERPLIALRDSVVAVAWRAPDGSIVARVGTLRNGAHP